MQRIEGGPVRPDFMTQVRNEGLAYVETVDPEGNTFSYWREGEFLKLTDAETRIIAYAAERLFQMFINASQHVIDQQDPALYARFGIPEWAIPVIEETWKDPGDPGARLDRYYPMMYGRFDFCLVRDVFGKVVGVKLLEYNADTPTGMVETAMTQWNWYLQLHQNGGNGQWNELFEKLVDGWITEAQRLMDHTDLLNYDGRKPPIIHFAYMREEDSGEDALNCGLMMEAAREAARRMGTAKKPAFEVKSIFIEEIRRTGLIDEDTGQPLDIQAFTVNVDPDDDNPRARQEPIKVLFKLYPWEWMWTDEFGPMLCDAILAGELVVIEPPYKALWSNKAILPILWELFGRDLALSEFLLPAYFEDDPRAATLKDRVRKPVLGREGANTTIILDNQVVDEGPDQDYGDEGFIVQQYCPLPAFPSELEPGTTYTVVAGVWTVQDYIAGMCARQSKSLVTDNQSGFLPHIVTDVSPENY
jgi:glutathionylspermidine synthase